MSRPILSLLVTKGNASTVLRFNRGQDSFGTSDIFIGARPPKGFEELRGWPLHAVRTWLGARSYKVENYSSGHAV